MKSGIISSIVTESCTQGVIFATVAFGVGIDSLYVERVIHLVYLALRKVSAKIVEVLAEVEGSFVWQLNLLRMSTMTWMLMFRECNQS